MKMKIGVKNEKCIEKFVVFLWFEKWKSVRKKWERERSDRKLERW